MSLTPQIIDALVASGLTVEQLATAIKAMLADGEARKAVKRMKDAERQREYRLSRVTGRDNARQGVTSRDSEPLHSCEDIISPRPLKGAAPQRGSRLPEDFVPDPVSAQEQGLSPSEAHREGLKFVDHWRAASGANARKRDWRAAERNWYRNAAERRPRQNGTGPPKRGSSALSDLVSRPLNEIFDDPPIH